MIRQFYLSVWCWFDLVGLRNAAVCFFGCLTLYVPTNKMILRTNPLIWSVTPNLSVPRDRPQTGRSKSDRSQGSKIVDLNSKLIITWHDSLTYIYILDWRREICWDFIYNITITFRHYCLCGIIFCTEFDQCYICSRLIDIDLLSARKKMVCQ